MSLRRITFDVLERWRLDIPGRDRAEGLFFRNRSVRIAEITDGTSQTLALGQKSQNLARARWTGAVSHAAVPITELQAEDGLSPEGGGAMVLSHTGDSMVQTPDLLTLTSFGLVTPAVGISRSPMEASASSRKSTLWPSSNLWRPARRQGRLC